MWSSHVRWSAVWVGIQLVSAVAATMTSTSTCDVVRFNQSRAETGAVLCATAPPPDDVVAMNTKTECSRECATRDATCAGGFNYKHQEALCELFASPPSTLQVQQGCEYYAVCTSSSLLYIFPCTAYTA